MNMMEVITVNWTCWQWDEQDDERNIKLDCKWNSSGIFQSQSNLI